MRIPTAEARLRRDAPVILRAALDAVEPERLVREAWARCGPRADDHGRVVVIAFGKAALPMTWAVERTLGPRIACGAVVVPRGTTAELPDRYRVFQAGHPDPDEGSLAAAHAVRDLARSAGPTDLLIALISGGGSSLLTLPPAGVPLSRVAAAIGALSRAGAPIQALNAVRKQLDQLKGGRLARWAAPARVLALILSDVPGDAPDVVASGPLAPAGRSTSADALALVRALRARVVDGPDRGALAWALQQMERSAPGSPDAAPAPDDDCFRRVTSVVVGSGATAAAAAGRAAQGLGYSAEVVAAPVSGDVGDVAETLATWARLRSGRGKACRVSAGEPTVRVRGDGSGGRNQHLVLEAAARIDGLPSALIASLASDGVDGPTPAAGGQVTGTTARRARDAGLEIRACLDRNDSGPVLCALGDRIVTGPTATNVADIQLVLVE